MEKGTDEGVVHKKRGKKTDKAVKDENEREGGAAAKANESKQKRNIERSDLGPQANPLNLM